MRILSTLLLLLTLLPSSSSFADGTAGTPPHLHLTLRRNILDTEALLTWDGAGTLEQSSDLRRWGRVSTPPLFSIGRTRSAAVDLGRAPQGQFFRLRLPEPVDTDHLHITREDLFLYDPAQQVEAIDPGWTLSRRLPVHRIPHPCHPHGGHERQLCGDGDRE